MKTLVLIILMLFPGKTPEKIRPFKAVVQSRLRPTTDQKFQLYASEIGVLNSELREDIYELKNEESDEVRLP